MSELYGRKPARAIANFRSRAVASRAAGALADASRDRGACQRRAGLLDAELPSASASRGRCRRPGEHDDQFPIDVFQTGWARLRT